VSAALTHTRSGFSNYFSRPRYQDSAVHTYFSEHDPGYPYYNFNGIEDSKNGTNIGKGGLYNRKGRAFPDVSANGAGLQFFDTGVKQPIAGTSLSAPIWASMLTLINEKRTEVGKSPVGFVQPVLYHHPEVFNDITEGNNPGCGTEGFGAVKGWVRRCINYAAPTSLANNGTQDPLTGLGICHRED
jgi:tripeptidyl-peptidase-1